MPTAIVGGYFNISLMFQIFLDSFYSHFDYGIYYDISLTTSSYEKYTLVNSFDLQCESSIYHYTIISSDIIVWETRLVFLPRWRGKL